MQSIEDTAAIHSPTGFWAGAALPWRGLVFVGRRPRLFIWVIAPALIGLCMVIGAWMTVWYTVPPLIGSLWARPEVVGLWQNLWTFTVLVVMGFFFMGAALLSYGLIGILGTPFYDRLSAAVEHEIGGSAEDAFDLRQTLSDIWWSVVHSVVAMGLWIFVVLGLFSLNLIPVVGGVLEVLLSTIATWVWVAREMLDGALSRRQMSFRGKLNFMKAHSRTTLGLGASTAVLLWIPLVNILMLPMGIVGATLMVLEAEDRAT
jgi:CysZ protein